ncbi:CBS domain-containing protein [Thiohalobacter sp. IOR34]|uniref:CBS domain-containing protein n=1 Tax=Thiohalobacter sp. IOR34 TaxID=3057176 RepID=UPI0025B213F1|nr:CBS domain-containing protein [Thiohalobacter sp. IOR34]WJW76420.1 CBS domain-containing protein [Thiohalobacter sp. IOR34]
MPIGEFCNREVIVVTREESISTAVKLMRDQHVGALVVIEAEGSEQIPVGILTDRDIVIEILAEEVDIDTVTVGDIMSFKLKTAREDEEVADVVRRMRAYGVRRMPVVDEQGALQGLITLDDLIELLAEEMADLAGLIGREQRRERLTRA